MVRRCKLREIVLLGFAASALVVPLHAAAQAKKKPAAKDFGKELQELVYDDQRDQNTDEAEAITEDFSRRQAVRRARCMEIVNAGGLATGRDFCNAAVLFQHGTEIDDFLRAHVLASAAAFEGGVPFGEFFSAAGLDRFLMHLRQPQRFGTQGTDPRVTNLEDYEPSIGESVRKVFQLDPLPKPAAAPAEAKAPKKPSTKELAARAKEFAALVKARDDDERAHARRVEILGWAMELVRTGDFAKPEELLRAAQILHEGETAEHLLHAHVLAVAAGIRKHPEGRQLAAASLDRWLMELGRPQWFGTQIADAKAPVEPFDRWVPDSVRRAYGLEPLAAAGKAGGKR